jgi:peptidyl-prolyl cis-trans isomerase B (cyclophilin B)
MVTLKTAYGDIVLDLDAERAPKTVENFLQYVRDGFYDGTLFHRVIDGFMIQGGGFRPGMIPKQTRPGVENEAKNGLKNLKGTIAMARTTQPHSATAQFFINLSNNGFLDYPGQDGWGYCVFGTVVEGMDVVERIKAVQTSARHGHQDVPVDDVVIEQALIDE